MSDIKRAKAHKIEVRRRPGSEGTIQNGATTEIYLDGKKLSGAYFFKFEVHAKKMAKVHIEMFAEVDIETDVFLNDPKPINRDKKLSPYVLSSYESVLNKNIDLKIK